MSTGVLALIGFAAAATANAQSFRVQCPTSTITHPTAASNNSEPAYTSATAVNGAIKCQQISGGDGYATMGDGTQTYMFSFGPLSGLAKIANGQPGTDFPYEFNVQYTAAHLPPAIRPLPGCRRSITTARWAWCLTRTR